MGRPYREVLTGLKIYVCGQCHTHLTTHGSRISTQFRGRTGAAWLFDKVVNVAEGSFEDRVMTTGNHTIVDIYCWECGTNVGWRYEFATEESQRYKEGKYILEEALLMVVKEDDSGQACLTSLTSDMEYE